MNFQEKLIEFKQQMFELITTKDISYLWNLDKRIRVNAEGKYNYHTLIELHNSDIWRFLHKLESDKIYVVIPILSKNNTPEEPFIILSQQFLVTKKSNHILISKYLSDKIDKTYDLYDMTYKYDLNITLKYKEVNLDYYEHYKFK